MDPTSLFSRRLTKVVQGQVGHNGVLLREATQTYRDAFDFFLLSVL